MVFGLAFAKIGGIMPVWPKKITQVVLIGLTVLLCFPKLAEAGTRRHKGPSTQKILTPHKIKVMAKHIARDLKQQDVFIKKDLPPKLSLGLFEVKVAQATATSRQFTDAVLNEILSNSPVLIVNQDAQIGESMDFQLQRYEDSRTLRIRAALLGASYYLVGETTEHTVTLKPGKVKLTYKVDYGVYDVHTNANILQHNLLFTEGGKLLKEQKPNGRRQKTKR